MSIYAEPVEWLRESIESIRSQTYTDFEFIIVNDNPGHSANAEYLTELVAADSRIRLITNAENIGLTRSLNAALAAATGTYIARMDADDIAVKDRFEKQLNFLDDHPDYIGCGSNVKIIDETGAEKGTLVKPKEYAEIRATLFFESPIVHPTLFFRKSEIRYNELYRYSQDFDFISQLAAQGKLYNLQEVLLAYRNSTKQISASKIKEQNAFAQAIRGNNVLKYLKNNYHQLVRSKIESVDQIDQQTLFDLLRRHKQDRQNLSAILYSVAFYSAHNKQKSIPVVLKSQAYLKLPFKHRLRFLLMPVMNFRDQIS